MDPFVLQCMGKPDIRVYDAFREAYYHMNERCGMKQFLVPYLISGHPGSDLKAAVRLAEYVRDMGYNPEQIQEFYPTPGTLSTAMYYTEMDPRTMKRIHVAKTPEEKAMQRALIQFRDPRNQKLVLKALQLAGRDDLIGFGPKALVRPMAKKAEPKVPEKEQTPQRKKRAPQASKSKGYNSGREKRR